VWENLDKLWITTYCPTAWLPAKSGQCERKNGGMTRGEYCRTARPNAWWYSFCAPWCHTLHGHHVYKTMFVITLSKHISFRTVKYIPNHQGSTIAQRTIHPMVAVYKCQGFCTVAVKADPKFHVMDCLMPTVTPVESPLAPKQVVATQWLGKYDARVVKVVVCSNICCMNWNFASNCCIMGSNHHLMDWDININIDNALQLIVGPAKLILTEKF